MENIIKSDPILIHRFFIKQLLISFFKKLASRKEELLGQINHLKKKLKEVED